MFATRRNELGKEHIRPIQVGGESFDMNTPPGGANCRCDCDGYRPDTLGGGIGQSRLLFGVMGTREGGSEFGWRIFHQSASAILAVTICGRRSVFTNVALLRG